MSPSAAESEDSVRGTPQLTASFKSASSDANQRQAKIQYIAEAMSRGEECDG